MKHKKPIAAGVAVLAAFAVAKTAVLLADARAGETREDRAQVRGPAAERRENAYERYGKPVLDSTLSFLGLLALSPVCALASGLIWLDDPGPVVFTQRRIGKDGREFLLHKFRSMRMDTPHDVPTHLLDDPDRYITRVGRLIRRTSIDELPQIWDIFSGRMSIVGPRPALWNQDDLIAEREKYGANDVKPGLTGWAQINGRDELSIAEKARRDGEYAAALKADSRTAFKMDVRCFFGTFLKVLRHEGVREGADQGSPDTEGPEGKAGST